ncbi:Ger(x)C family spore germination protein [Clostridium sp. JNZ X4-2]
MINFKKSLKKLNLMLLAISLVISGFCITGCTDKNEIETLAFPVALGVDLDKDNNFIVSIQILKGMNSLKTQGTKQILKTDVYVCSGSTIHNALNNLSKKLSMPIKFSNEKFIVVGQNLAEYSIKPIIDFSLRFSEIRPTTPILVTHGKAEDILKTQVTENPISAYAINYLIARQKYLGFSPTTTNLEFENSMNSQNPISTCGVIDMCTKNENTSNSSFLVAGSAVFREDKLIGYMNTDETRGMQWIKGKIKLGNIVIYPHNKSKISLDIIKSSSRLKPSINNNRANIEVYIKAQSNISEISNSTYKYMDFNRDPIILDELSEEQNKAIHSEVSAAINASQNRLSADIFDFGNLLYREYPDEWKGIKNNWDKSFPNINIKVNISSKINQTGTISKSIDAGKGK